VAKSLALVIPAFDEERRIADSLQRLRPFVEARPHIESVTVVDDGSGDRTREVVGAIAADWPRLRIVSLGTHRGKGAAVRAGVLAGHGTFAVAFTDADLSADIGMLDALLVALDVADVAIASRALRGARLVVRESAIRELMGKAYSAVVRATVLSGIPDAHCGLKAYRSDVAREIFGRSVIDGVLFDLEVLVLAALEGRKIAQLPATWAHDRDSRIGVGVPFAFRVARDLATIKLRHRARLPLRPRLVAPYGR